MAKPSRSIGPSRCKPPAANLPTYIALLAHLRLAVLAQIEAQDDTPKLVGLRTATPPQAPSPSPILTQTNAAWQPNL
ncbi:hypothetical protein K449DRAFT_432400 [Hypoxylon sp. EC38]|nr:hypothetical protein K449DRAFT_432400 [Hypoxylon sp. EC38]